MLITYSLQRIGIRSPAVLHRQCIYFCRRRLNGEEALVSVSGSFSGSSCFRFCRFFSSSTGTSRVRRFSKRSFRVLKLLVCMRLKPATVFMVPLPIWLLIMFCVLRLNIFTRRAPSRLRMYSTVQSPMMLWAVGSFWVLVKPPLRVTRSRPSNRE